MWMLQLQRVGVSRLRPRDQEGERDERLLRVCAAHTATDSFGRRSCVLVRALGNAEGDSKGRQREERDFTKADARCVYHVSALRAYYMWVLLTHLCRTEASTRDASEVITLAFGNGF